MPLLSLCRTGVLPQGQFFAPAVARAAVALMAASAAVPVRGDASGAATRADAAEGERACSRTQDDAGREQPFVDAPNAAEEQRERPIWYDYGYDQLFEEYFKCGDILYGYENVGFFAESDRVYYEDADDSEDYSEDYSEDAVDEAGGAAEGSETVAEDEDEDPLSEFQLQKLRQQWAAMRDQYARGENLAQLALDVRGESGESDHGHGGVSAMVVPSRVGDAGPGKGRGVFAAAPIPRDALVVDLDNGSTGFFKEGRAWRAFAASLPHAAACDFLEWSWVQRVPPRHAADADARNGLTIFVAFDASNLLNNADWGGAAANVRCGPPPRAGRPRGPCRFRYHATRDIAAGEELLVSYGDFEEADQRGWAAMGLDRWV